MIENLERLHSSVRSDVEAYCQRLASAVGENIKAVSVYGSATGPDFVPEKSNVNLVVVVARLDQPVLEALLGIVKWGGKKRIVPPLLLTAEYIQSSLDVFPIEFLEIRESQVLLYGDDFFSSIQVKPDDLRLECESQIKAAILRTRQAYLELGLTKKGAESVLHASLTSLIPVFRAMLQLKGSEVPRGKADVVDSLGKDLGVETETFLAILRDKAGDERIGSKEAHHVLARYIIDLERLAHKIDQL